MNLNSLSFFVLILTVLASLLHTATARQVHVATIQTVRPDTATAQRFQDDLVGVNCAPVEQTMTPLCGDRDHRQYHAYVCEKQCIDAVKHLLRKRRQDEQDGAPHALCLAEWKSIGRVQAAECPTELQSFLPTSAFSVSTIASAVLSIFVLFSCS